MLKLPEFTRTRDLRFGTDPAQDAWLHHFLTENNLEYMLNPELIAAPEQLRFMVALEEDQVYVPCDDALFRHIYTRDDAGPVLREYIRAWRFIFKLVNEFDLDRSTRKRILNLCRYRLQLYLASRLVLPSRIVKRLVGIVLTQTGNLDPFSKRKRQSNAKAARVLQSDTVQKSLYRCPDISACGGDMQDLRLELDFAELRRLFRLATFTQVWQTELSPLSIEEEIHKPCDYCECLRLVFAPDNGEGKKILYIPDVAGGFIFDIAILRSLLRQGHQVILALKEGFYFDNQNIWDLREDPALQKEFEGVFVLENNSVPKNELLQHLREHRLVVISDGTSEQLNLYRVSVTFARAWKECDLVIAKGRRNAGVLLNSSHELTRDILCFWRAEDGEFRLQCRPKAAWARQFPEKYLTLAADEIIAQMREARRQGKTVMFYSAVIGSIPGQTKTAVSLVNAFVRNLRDKLENTFIINPAEHFEEGMDADDLMFMWEKVQRSGLLDVWRFQTVEDVETGFTLLGRKVPSVWSGKDATFSTGCTKEMHIALSMQEKHPEMQIIGPAPEKFLRRREYGVGKYFDSTIRP